MPLVAAATFKFKPCPFEFNVPVTLSVTPPLVIIVFELTGVPDNDVTGLPEKFSVPPPLLSKVKVVPE